MAVSLCGILVGLQLMGVLHFSTAVMVVLLLFAILYTVGDYAEKEKRKK